MVLEGSLVACRLDAAGAWCLSRGKKRRCVSHAIPRLFGTMVVPVWGVFVWVWWGRAGGAGSHEGEAVLYVGQPGADGSGLRGGCGVPRPRNQDCCRGTHPALRFLVTSHTIARANISRDRMFRLFFVQIKQVHLLYCVTATCASHRSRRPTRTTSSRTSRTPSSPLRPRPWPS
jgi:hypothetical protein